MILTCVKLCIKQCIKVRQLLFKTLNIITILQRKKTSPSPKLTSLKKKKKDSAPCGFHLIIRAIWRVFFFLIILSIMKYSCRLLFQTTTKIEKKLCCLEWLCIQAATHCSSRFITHAVWWRLKVNVFRKERKKENYYCEYPDGWTDQ